LGPNDIRISDTNGIGDANYDAERPAIAYNSLDGEYAVVFRADDVGGGTVNDEYEIYGQLLSATGAEIGGNDLRLSFVHGSGDASYAAEAPDIAHDSVNDRYLAVWSADEATGGLANNEFEIWGQVLDADLAPLFGAAFRISSMGPDNDPVYDASAPALAFNPSRGEYLVVWSGDHNVGGLVNDELEIWAQRVDANGALVGANFRVSSMGGTGSLNYDALAPDVTFNTRDLEYLVVWDGDDDGDGLVDDEREIFAQRVSELGVEVGLDDAQVSDLGDTGALEYDALFPAVAYNRTANEYLAVWVGDDNVGGLVDEEFEVFGQRLAADLDPVGDNDLRLSDAGGTGSAGRVVDTTGDAVAVAFNPALQRYLVSWAGEDDVDGMVDGELEVFAQLLSWDGQELGPNDERISDAGDLGDAAYATRGPALAAHAANGQFLVAWFGEDNVGGLVDNENEIFVQRMDGLAVFIDGFEGGDTANWSSTVP